MSYSPKPRILLPFMTMGKEGSRGNSGCRADDIQTRRWSWLIRRNPMEPQRLTSVEEEAEDREPERWLLRKA